MRLLILTTTLASLLATATQAGPPPTTNDANIAVFPSKGTNTATISYGDGHTPYTFDTMRRGGATANFYDVDWRDNGERIARIKLATNTVQSRLRQMPSVLCTITNRVLHVEGRHFTNEVVLERLGVWCEEVPEELPAQGWLTNWGSSRLIVTPTSVSNKGTNMGTYYKVFQAE